MQLENRPRLPCPRPSICAGIGLVLNHLMVGDPEAFTLALLMAAVAVGIAAWQVWGRGRTETKNRNLR